MGKARWRSIIIVVGLVTSVARPQQVESLTTWQIDGIRLGMRLEDCWLHHEAPVPDGSLIERVFCPPATNLTLRRQTDESSWSIYCIETHGVSALLHSRGRQGVVIGDAVGYVRERLGDPVRTNPPHDVYQKIDKVWRYPCASWSPEVPGVLSIEVYMSRVVGMKLEAIAP